MGKQINQALLDYTVWKENINVTIASTKTHQLKFDLEKLLQH